MNEADIYSVIGDVGFERLIAAFYRRVRTDDILGPLYPPDDWDAAEARLRSFLIQRFGGPDDYSAARGHPRLRMRHTPFAIDAAAAERWLISMRGAMQETEIAPDVAAVLWPYFVSTATQMVNRRGDSSEEN